MNDLKANICRAVVEYLESEDFNVEKSRIKGYKNPEKIPSDDNAKEVPFILAKKDDTGLLFDIMEDGDELNDKINRLFNMSNYSRENKRKFYLVHPKNKEYTFKNFLNEHNIKAELLPVSIS